jgi:hypothetical protein
MKKKDIVFEPVIPAGSFGAPDEAIIQILENDILPKALGRNYSNITFKEAGGTKYIFQAKWAGGQKRIIKVDRPDHDLESPRAQRNVTKGYTTQHEIRMVASIPDPNEHGILPPIDFCDLREFRYPGAMLVEDHFESISLEKRVKDGKSLLSREAFQEYALQIAKTLSFMTEEQGKKYVEIGAELAICPSWACQLYQQEKVRRKKLDQRT